MGEKLEGLCGKNGHSGCFTLCSCCCVAVSAGNKLGGKIVILGVILSC